VEQGDLPHRRGFFVGNERVVVSPALTFCTFPSEKDGAMAKLLLFAKSSRRRCRTVAVTAGLLLVASVTWAQGSTQRARSDFASLQDAIKGTDGVIVRVQDGTKVRGRFLEASADHIAVLVGKTRREIPSEQVTRVQRKRNGIWLGALIGAAAGVPFTIAIAQYGDSERTQGGYAVLPIAIGFGVGAGLDALFVVPRTIYERPAAQAGATVGFRASPSAAGVTISF
jgi:hypothetical protein